eukprot:GILI01015663.1.p1 GENE.GILI01015663.1~~GILI01015663.1.p1  ORF type:complete len:479 (+),score=119.79 GILI01015663.1:96-1532(+)
MKSVSLFLLAAVLSASVSASILSLVPDRLRHGSVFADLKAKTHSETTLMKEGGQFVNATVNYFDQWIDHTNHSKGTFKQRYWIDLSNYTDNIAMLYISGEGEAYGSPDGYVGIFGQSLGGALFTLEHRYYGPSMPAPFTDFVTLRTLQVDQVLADLAGFRDFAQQQYFGARNMAWYCAGGSYSGALSTWLRQAYPEKFVAAWASSGVVNARFEFYEFDDSLLRVIPRVCAENIRTVFQLWEQMWDSDPASVQAIFGTPAYFTKEDMAWMLSDGGAMAVQYGSKYFLCDSMVPLPADPLATYANVIQTLWGQSFTSNCYYSTECLSNPAYESTWGPGTYGWVFQTCYQFAFWQGGYPGSLRPQLLTTDYYMNQCRTAWWEDILPNTYQFNRKYGGIKPNTTRVIATQGSDDPWQYAGVNISPGPEYPVARAQCDTCGHCGEMQPPTPTDPLSLQQQRVSVAGNMTKWIREAQALLGPKE